MATLTAFIDTNYFLHYVLPDQIEWAQALGADEVVIMIAPVVLSELGRQKDSNPARKLRDRAATTLRWLDRMASNGLHSRLRDGVSLEFVAREPAIDFPTYGLDPGVQDDRLLACILEHATLSAPGVLVTADVGLKVKARQRGVRVYSPPDEDKLPDTQDPTEARVKELEQTVRKLKERTPQLAITFEDGSQRKVFGVDGPKVLSEGEIEKSIRALQAKLPFRRLAVSPGSDIAFDITLPGKAQAIGQYNEALKKHFADYETFLRETIEFDNAGRRVVLLAMRLANDGGSPAEDIDLRMHFPDGFLLFDKKSLPTRPQEPTPPPEPMGSLESIVRDMAIPDLASRALLSAALPNIHPVRPPPNVSSPRIKRTGSYEVTFHVGRLKHTFKVPPDPLYVYFERFEDASSFGIDYEVIASNTPQRSKGRLDVIIEKAPSKS